MAYCWLVGNEGMRYPIIPLNGISREISGASFPHSLLTNSKIERLCGELSHGRWSHVLRELQLFAVKHFRFTPLHSFVGLLGVLELQVNLFTHTTQTTETLQCCTVPNIP